MPEPHSPISDRPGLEAAFRRIRDASRADPASPLAQRRSRLNRLEAMLQENREAICDAVNADFGQRSRHETALLELFPSLEGIRHARRHMARWSRPERRPVSHWFKPGRAEVRPQPLGCIGIITPWNYPVYLTFGPLTAAFAAGNRALVKMSEFTPATARLLAELAARYFGPDELAIVEGDVTIAEAFARLPFDHLLFTGSTAVGRHVMRAAAENLTPVTLELGGKSPAIIGPDYPIDKAAARILAGKCLNAGQTCIAPDYVLVPAGKEEEFVAAARRVVSRGYPALERNPDYTAVVNSRHFTRLTGYLDEARAGGATVIPLGGDVEEAARTRRLPPTLVLNPREDMRVMQEEIFGPVMPVLTYGKLDEAIDFVNRRDRPLALYLFDRHPQHVRRVLEHTVSGGVTINDTILHIAQDDLPFGGVGPSGMGHYHGREGFMTFSKLKPVFHQARINGIGLFNPPYGRLFERMLKVLLR